MEAMKKHLMEQAKCERNLADECRTEMRVRNAQVVRESQRAVVAQEKAAAHEAMALECERLAAQYDVPVAPEWAKEFVPDSVNAQHVGGYADSGVVKAGGNTVWVKDQSPCESALRASGALTGYGADSVLHVEKLSSVGDSEPGIITSGDLTKVMLHAIGDPLPQLYRDGKWVTVEPMLDEAGNIVAYSMVDTIEPLNAARGAKL